VALSTFRRYVERQLRSSIFAVALRALADTTKLHCYSVERSRLCTSPEKGFGRGRFSKRLPRTLS